MRIINTFDKIPGCFKNSAFDLDAWRVYARAISPELGEKCERDSREYDFKNDVLPVVNNVLLNRDAAIAANDSFVAVTDKLASNIERLFENGVETDIILYLGLCNGAGWATALDGRDAVLLGIEKIIELNWQDESAMQALIFHEIGHIWHKPTGISIPRLGQRAKIHWLSSIKRDLPWSASIFYARMTDTIIKIKTAGSIGARKTKPK